MMVLVTYDVSPQSAAGIKRLGKVAKQCQNYGQRLQNSVFQCILDLARLKQLQNDLENLIDHGTDSLRYYYMGNNWRKRVQHIGAKATTDLEDTLIA